MSSIVLVSPITFGPDPKTKGNALISSMNVSCAQADMDRSQVCTLVDELEDFFSNGCGIRTVVIHQSREPKHSRRLLQEKGGSVCVAESLSFHNIVDTDGVIQRRIVVFYPMSPLRRGELAQKQVIERIKNFAESSDAVELIDLRGYESEGKYLEGSGSLVFSPGCRYVYMAVSQHSDPDVLDTLCSPENLNIHPEKRFLLRAMDGLPHTNVLGWCGTGICAWCIVNLGFATEGDEVAFFDHLFACYSRVLELSEAEMLSFGGCAVEVPTQPVGADAHSVQYALVLSESALAALSPKNHAMLVDWYGASNIHTFYGEVLERRLGTSLPSCMAASYTHGPRQPMTTQESTCDVLHLGEAM
ncbi:hypothetical protein ABL78_4209 [Leptomonas seymouri]|uniref:Amidinotransferase n=1 Tax=Leptomonas seymouri TaxID=5684 RepID=A0A0N0P5Q5_LEPSE|nr:hypothetical protein ABL78_4209 [Leptomonas seymouri]|eukprot:KPI86739.1 hypothetical protein ABL78_4209 [Leptomonas seymouri]